MKDAQSATKAGNPDFLWLVFREDQLLSIRAEMNIGGDLCVRCIEDLEGGVFISGGVDFSVPLSIDIENDSSANDAFAVFVANLQLESAGWFGSHQQHTRALMPFLTQKTQFSPAVPSSHVTKQFAFSE